jgi:hypothetical protein
VGHPLAPSRKGRASRRKGLDAERVLVRYLQGRGLNATKVSRTGYAGTDLSVDLLGISRSIECKVRSRAFGQLYSWLANSDILVIRADRKEPLCLLPLWLAAEVARVAEGFERERCISSSSIQQREDASHEESDDQ